MKPDRDRARDRKALMIRFFTSVFALFSITVSIFVDFPAEAQQPKKIPRVGFIDAAGSAENPSTRLMAWQQGLQALGYIQNKNILLDVRYAEGDLQRIPRFVKEFVGQKVDVIIATNNVAIRAAKEATRSIPVVMLSSIDPVAAGYVSSLARPGGNMTGIAKLDRDLSAKRVELLKEIFPKMSRVAVLWDADGPGTAVAFKEYRAASDAFGLKVLSLEVRGPTPDLESAFRAAKKARAEAFVVVSNPLIRRYQKQIAGLATEARIPSIAERPEYVEDGMLVSYSPSDNDLYRRAATYVDKILKGAKPADLPVEQPTKFELVINLKTAKQIGVTIPQSMLYRADKVIK